MTTPTRIYVITDRRTDAQRLVRAILESDYPLDSTRLAKLIDRPASDVLQLLAAAERARLVRRTRNARGFYQWESA